MTPLFCFARTDRLEEDGDLTGAILARLPPERRKKAERLRPGRERVLSVTAGALLSLALARQGMGEWADRVAYTPCGKPFLPKSPGGIGVSLSHGGSFALCAVAPCEVGCDVEPIPARDPMPIAERFFAGEEVALLHDLPPEERRRAFTFLWTAKESYVKALGTGFMTPPGDVPLTFSAGQITLLRQGEPYSFFGEEREGAVFACCFSIPCDGIRLCELDPAALLEL